jgi:hypothetical protein
MIAMNYSDMIGWLTDRIAHFEVEPDVELISVFFWYDNRKYKAVYASSEEQSLQAIYVVETTNDTQS